MEDRGRGGGNKPATKLGGRNTFRRLLNASTDTNLRETVSDPGYCLRASIFCENGIARDDTFELTRVGAVNHGDERVNIHVAERGIERKIGVETGQRLRGENGGEGKFALAFLEEALEFVAADGVPALSLIHI